MTDNAIRVWRFHEAPPEMRALSPHGGDEDWVAHVPASYGADPWISWADDGTPFAICDASRHPQPDGSMVIIGAHA